MCLDHILPSPGSGVGSRTQPHRSHGKIASVLGHRGALGKGSTQSGMAKSERREEVSVWCGTRRFLERQKGKKKKKAPFVCWSGSEARQARISEESRDWLKLTLALLCARGEPGLADLSFQERVTWGD